MFRVVLTCLLLFAVQTAVAIEDPTRPVTQGRVLAATVRALPQLKTIIVSPNRRLAMIDDRVLAEGEYGGAIKLLRVETDAVVVRLGSGEEMRLTLASNKIHKEMK